MKLDSVTSGLGKTGFSAAPGGHPSPIEMGHLSRQSLGDEALGDEILLLFAKSAHIYLDRVLSSADSSERMVHLRRLGLAAKGVGAFHLADLVRMAELELSTDPSDTECLADLGFAVEEVASFVADRLKAARCLIAA